MKHLIFFLILLSTVLGQDVHAAAQEILLVSQARPGSPQRVVAETFKKLLEAEPATSFTVTLRFYNPDLTEAEAIEKIQIGTLQMGIFTAASLEDLNPITRVPSFPFLFGDEQQAALILDGPLGATLLRDLETIGCKGLAFSDGGFRHLTNALRPVHTVDDLKGLKIRVLSAPLPTATWLALGAEPVPMSWPIYAELEEGLLDGQENPLWIVESYNFFDVQQYLTLTRHSYTALINVASLKWWQTLTIQQQNMIQDTMIAAARLQRQDQRAKEAARLTLLKNKGMIIDEQPDIAAFRSSVARLKELPIYREPRVQLLLTRMLQAALVAPAPGPATSVHMEPGGDTALPDQKERMQEPLRPEPPQANVPAQGNAEALAVPESTDLADPFDTPMQPLENEQPDPDAQQKEMHSTPPKQHAGTSALQPSQQPTGTPLQPVPQAPFTMPDDGPTPTAPATNETLPLKPDERMLAPTGGIHQPTAASQSTEEALNGASIDPQKTSEQTALPRQNVDTEPFPDPVQTQAPPQPDNIPPIDSTSD